ncbi:hypothetical protein HF1_13620 [Mycoplasma haemofelis str. Langford 1]|uniref:Uncharacterized protein n=1 Tax=Mycoplasma haemofelis (strain Langford 1) TaxID=941640 RepID=E8ZJP9_MYCHL|nr:hypothetical protein [Mycoplasma haemofelis]CBY93370.1 hypothetical protein HF1_13620 [Mycoplasma haemofelis str. Langford 1]
MPTSLKTVAPIVGLGGVGTAGGYYLLSDSSTIRDHLKTELKGLPRKILSSESSAEWSEWKKVYESKSSNQKIAGVSDASDLPKWCADTLNQKFDKSKYDVVKSWCVVNTSTLKGELASSGVTLISSDGSDVETKFKNAWKKVKAQKSTAGDLAINDTTVISDSSSDETAGGTALKTWCTTRYSWAMYKLDAINDLEKVKKWCHEDAGKDS